MSPAELETKKKVCYYKWEFLRRNPEYQEDYREFLELCNKNNWDPKSDTVRYETFERDPTKRKALNYGIAFLENPDKHILLEKFEENPFWPIIEDRGLKRPTWPSILKPHYPKGEPVIKIYTDQFEEKIAAPLALIIDLTYPKSEIMGRVKKLINEAIEERKIRGLLIHKGRKRFDVYSQYLKIWDLRKKELTFGEIAAEVYPDEVSGCEHEDEDEGERYQKRLEELIDQGMEARSAYTKVDKEFGVGGKSPIQRVFMQYKEADKLVNGAYKEIV